MSDDRWYVDVGGCLAVLPSIGSFIGSWWYCVDEYGYLLGFGFGWIPSLILAAIVYLAVTFLWGVIAVGVVIFGAMILRENTNSIPSNIVSYNLYDNSAGENYENGMTRYNETYDQQENKEQVGGEPWENFKDAPDAGRTDEELNDAFDQAEAVIDDGQNTEPQ